GKSPNEFGFSQAAGMRQMGLPYFGVLHLIVSDSSPRTNWKPMGVLKILDRYGRVEILPDEDHDHLPYDLIQRTYGRLSNNSLDSACGYAAVYIHEMQQVTPRIRRPSDAYSVPWCKPSERNPTF